MVEHTAGSDSLLRLFGKDEGEPAALRTDVGTRFKFAPTMNDADRYAMIQAPPGCGMSVLMANLMVARAFPVVEVIDVGLPTSAMLDQVLEMLPSAQRRMVASFGSKPAVAPKNVDEDEHAPRNTGPLPKRRNRR